MCSGGFDGNMDITNERNNAIDAEVVASISDKLFQVMPLLRKRMLRVDGVQSEYGIPFSHVQVLAMLENSGSMSVSEISRRFGIAKPNITPLVDRLISAGFVERVRNKADRRVVDVYILDSGRQKLKEIQQALHEQVISWSDTISSQDFVELSDALSTIIRIMGEI
ncbi:MAG: MarR family transcriptional regulator [Clostridiales bacterium]|nr:MarR family transcriptional regulator [Clostridiales bacterium]